MKAPVCPLCRGAGFVRRDLPPGHPEFGRAVPCSCSADKVRAQRKQRLYQLSNIGSLKRMTFADFHSEGYGMNDLRKGNLRLAYDKAMRFAHDPKGWLLLRGGYGCGKTHLAVAIANHRIEQGEQPLFVVVPDLLDHLRATYGPNSEVSYDERFEQIRNASLLILDDLGTQNATSWAQEKLFQLFNHRYNMQLPTVVTTNQALEDIEVRIRSRLADPDLTDMVMILAPDYRQSGVEQGESDLSTLPLLAHMVFDRFDLRALELADGEREKLRTTVLAARRFASDPSGWFVLSGGFGVGKTHLAAAIANAQHLNGQPVLFIVVPDLLDHLRATYSPTSNVSYDKRFEHIKRVPLLVLDDLGTQSATPWAREKLFQLFNYRYMAQLPTVITLNDFEAVENRLLERMMEMKAVGMGSMLDLSVPPFRGRNTAERDKGRRRG